MKKYKYSRKQWVSRHFGNRDEMGDWDKTLVDRLLATKPTKVKKIERVDFAKWQDNRDMDIEIMIENKLNQLIDAVNSLHKQ